MWVKAGRYRVALPTSKTNAYTEASSEEAAIRQVTMREPKRGETPTGVYISKMVENAEVESWPDPLPELHSRGAVSLLKNVVAQQKQQGAYPVNWEGITKDAQRYGIGTEDIQKIVDYLKTPPQQTELALKAFIKDTNEGHPGAEAAGTWKREHKMKFITIDKVEDIVGDDDIVISIKFDGELVAVTYSGEYVETVTPRGTIRTGLPATNEAAELLNKSKHKSATFVGELYATDEKGVPQSYMKSASILKDPSARKDHMIKLAIFDIIELDGQPGLDISMQDKVQVIQRIFGDGQTVHPALFAHGSTEAISKLWDQLEEQGWEGLVLHVGTQLYKVKPILSYDMAVVAVEKSPRYVDRIGAVLCAFIDKDGRWRLNGMVGGGFSDAEKVALLDWAKKHQISEDEDRIWVDPFAEPLVVEVEAAEVNIKDRPKMEFKDHKWVQIEEDWSGVLRFPHFLRFRDDKEPTHDDVPLEQLPVDKEASIMPRLFPGCWIRTVTGHVGQIQQLVDDEDTDSLVDFNLVVEWRQPLFGKIKSSMVHPTEVMQVWQ